MKRIYKTAQGKQVDLDNLILSNEDTIAVGNMNVNARGDQLGPGGVVANGRNQNMDDYYKLYTPVAKDIMPDNKNSQAEAKKIAVINKSQGVDVASGLATEVAQDPPFVPQPVTPVTETGKQELRGSLADSLAKQTVVEQPLLKDPRKKSGPQRL